MLLRRASFAAVLVAATPHFAAAQAPGDTPATEYEACKQRRAELYAQATSQTDIDERTRLLQSMPECHRPPDPDPMPRAVAPPPPGQLVFAPSEREAPPPSAADTAKASITIAPLTTVLIAALGGVAFEARGEGLAAPHVGLGVTAGYAYVPALLSQDVMISVYTVSPQVVYYMQRFSGLHVGAAAMYAHGANTAGTGFLGGEVSEGSANMFAGSGFVGYKWIRPSGFTASAQLGIAVTRYRDSDSMEPAEVKVLPAGGLYAGWSL